MNPGQASRMSERRLGPIVLTKAKNTPPPRANAVVFVFPLPTVPAAVLPWLRNNRFLAGGRRVRASADHEDNGRLDGMRALSIVK